MSRSAQAYDRDRKVPLYAVAGLAEVSLVDHMAGVVEVYREPGSDGYAVTMVRGRGESIVPQLLPGIDVAVERILP